MLRMNFEVVRGDRSQFGAAQVEPLGPFASASSDGRALVLLAICETAFVR